MAPDLGLGPEIWLLLTLLISASIFFSFRRVLSLRNLDLLLLFLLAPGLMALTGRPGEAAWVPYLWLFAGTGLLLLRCLIDLGLPRRPLLEPNLNAPGLSFLAIGMIALLIAETISLPIRTGAARNPADSDLPTIDAATPIRPLSQVDDREAVGAMIAPGGPGVVRWRSTRIILSRVLAGLAHVGIVLGLFQLGRKHFGRPIAGLSAAALYLILPYTRIEIVDSGQAVPAALVVLALLWYQRPTLASVAIGLAAGWMPACIGLVPLWIGFYRGRDARRFAAIGLAVVAVCAGVGWGVPALNRWAGAMGARNLAEAGLLPGLEPPTSGSLWSGLDPAYRLPVLIAYATLVAVVSIWPLQKNLGELIALSAAVLMASQFWYIEKGGTMVLLYQPLFLLVMFRPNLVSKRAPRPIDAASEAPPPLLRV